MTEIWKIEIPAQGSTTQAVQGWALANTAEEAKFLSGNDRAIISPDPDRLWISPKRVVWKT